MKKEMFPKFHILQRFETMKSMLFMRLINYSNLGVMYENVNKKLTDIIMIGNSKKGAFLFEMKCC